MSNPYECIWEVGTSMGRQEPRLRMQSGPETRAEGSVLQMEECVEPWHCFRLCDCYHNILQAEQLVSTRSLGISVLEASRSIPHWQHSEVLVRVFQFTVLTWERIRKTGALSGPFVRTFTNLTGEGKALVISQKFRLLGPSSYRPFHSLNLERILRP